MSRKPLNILSGLLNDYAAGELEMCDLLVPDTGQRVTCPLTWGNALKYVADHSGGVPPWEIAKAVGIDTEEVILALNFGEDHGLVMRRAPKSPE